MSAEQIKARFWVTKSAVTIYATFHQVHLTIRWPRTEDNAVRHVRTLIANLEELVKNGLEEVFVQDQAKRLDFEIDEFYKDEAEKREKPDDN